ncbi:hypothetical protein, partial [Candidatus Brocadia sapporoensis]|uniref:hypothetical protein n=1 Tax=Candidatus Brocadia sapporoensis TaxID=392547 RepID=UPI001E623AD6
SCHPFGIFPSARFPYRLLTILRNYSLSPSVSLNSYGIFPIDKNLLRPIMCVSNYLHNKCTLKKEIVNRTS